MFKVMVVDDEMIVRKGIKTSIEWSEHGIEIAAEAKNGQDALDKLQISPVDLILTDIRMPVMTGIELARLVRSRHPEIEMVLLSGYEDFQCAKEAMSIGIRHYLLKPVIAEKLVETLAQIRDHQWQKRLLKQGERLRSMLFNENLPLIKTQLMNCLIHKKTDTAEIIAKAGTLQIRFEGPVYQAIVIEIDDYPLFSERLSPKEREGYGFAFLNIAEETLDARFSGFASFGEPGQLIALINVPEEKSVLGVCEQIRLNMQQYLKLSVSIGIGRPAESLGKVDRSYAEAVQAIQQKAFQGKGEIIVYEDEPQSPLSAECSKKLVKDAIHYVANYYGGSIGLTEAAGHVSVTPAHLSKVFKDEMGITFIKWLNQFRMEEAKKLLKHTWMKTYEIAEKVGYPDYKYFSLMFKKHTGYSPRDYRNL